MDDYAVALIGFSYTASCQIFHFFGQIVGSETHFLVEEGIFEDDWLVDLLGMSRQQQGR